MELCSLSYMLIIEILEQLKKYNVDYLYLNPTETGLRREYQPLLHPEKELEEL